MDVSQGGKNPYRDVMCSRTERGKGEKPNSVKNALFTGPKRKKSRRAEARSGKAKKSPACRVPIRMEGRLSPNNRKGREDEAHLILNSS